MAPELDNYWFERSRKGRWCGTRTIAWQGRALTAVYSAIYFVVASAKTRAGLPGRRNRLG
jgi:hypothetical protein